MRGGHAAQIVALPDEEGTPQESGAAQQNGSAAQPSQAPSRLCFYLDGAHTEESMATCATWFADAIAADPPTHALPARLPGAAAVGGSSCNGAAGAGQQETQRLLLFNCMQVSVHGLGNSLDASVLCWKQKPRKSVWSDMCTGAQEREPQRLLRPLTEGLTRRGVPMHHALFVPADSSYSKLGANTGPLDLSWQISLQRIWDADLRCARQRCAGGKHATLLFTTPARAPTELPMTGVSLLFSFQGRYAKEPCTCRSCCRCPACKGWACRTRSALQCCPPSALRWTGCAAVCGSGLTCACRYADVTHQETSLCSSLCFR